MNANESGDRPHTDDGGSDGTAPVDAWRRDTTGDAPVADLAGEMASGIGTSSADITSRATSAVAAYLAWRSRSGLPLGSPDDLNDVDLARYRRDARPSRRAIELLQRVQRSQSGAQPRNTISFRPALLVPLKPSDRQVVVKSLGLLLHDTSHGDGSGGEPLKDAA